MPTLPRRYDIYAFIHKGLRAMMADSLLAVGCLDSSDSAETAAVAVRVEILLDCCSLHLADENTFVHAAMERARPGSSATSASDHHEHEQAIARLAQRLQALEQADLGLRAEAATCLYQELAVFVGDNYLHMQHEESHNNEILWQHYSDAEIRAINQAIVAALPAERVGLMLGWMVRYLNSVERAQLLSGLQLTLPEPAFAAILQRVETLLSAGDFGKLLRLLQQDMVSH